MQEGDRRLAEKSFDTFPQSINNLILAVDGGSQTHCALIGNGNSFFRVVNQRLCGNASAVEASATCKGFFSDNHLQAMLGCKGSGLVSTGATANDDEISLYHELDCLWVLGVCQNRILSCEHIVYAPDRSVVGSCLHQLGICLGLLGNLA